MAARFLIPSLPASWIYDTPHIYFKSNLHSIIWKTSFPFKAKNYKTKELSTKLLLTGILQLLSFEFSTELNPVFNHKSKHLCCVTSCSAGHRGKFVQADMSEMLTPLRPCKQPSRVEGVCRFSQSTRKEKRTKWCLMPTCPQLLNKNGRSRVKNWKTSMKKLNDEFHNDEHHVTFQVVLVGSSDSHCQSRFQFKLCSTLEQHHSFSNLMNIVTQ